MDHVFQFCGTFGTLNINNINVPATLGSLLELLDIIGFLHPRKSARTIDKIRYIMQFYI